MIAAVDHFDVYLFGKVVKVKTDHRPNLALTSGKASSELNPRLRRFALKLQGRVIMEYIPGIVLDNADGFSRIWTEPTKQPTDVSSVGESTDEPSVDKQRWSPSCTRRAGDRNSRWGRGSSRRSRHLWKWDRLRRSQEGGCGAGQLLPFRKSR